MINKMFKLGYSVTRRLGPSACAFRKFSSVPVQNVVSTDEKNGLEPENINNSTPKNTSQSNLVAKVFASLAENEVEKNVQINSKRKPKIDNQYQKLEEEINTAADVDNLLNVVQSFPIISRSHALKIVSTLSEWSSANKIKLVDFEGDPRFLKLCRILSKHRSGNITDGVNSVDDLNVIFSVTGDDEAIRLISSLSLVQNIKVMTALAQKKRRNTSMLRALAFNIAKKPELIDLKRCSDLLFAMSTLNFPDDLLMDRICNDIPESLPNNKDKSSVVGSIATSFKLMKYKDVELLDLLCQWIMENSSICRPQDMASVLISVANLGHVSVSEEFIEKISSEVHEHDIKPSMWLDVVWSLMVLDRVTTKQISSVLSTDFLEKVIRENADLSIFLKKKLLHIESYIKLTDPNYKGPFLHRDVVDNVPVVYSKEKEFLVESIMDTFKNLIASETFLKIKCDSQMGFLYDGECALDEKCNPVLLTTKSTPNKKVFRIALMALEYHDLCKKCVEPTGSLLLYKKLLEKKGYKVILIPYTEFTTHQKLVNRIQFLERSLKEVVLGKPE